VVAILHTPRLVLRPYTLSDWDSFRSLVQDEQLMWRLSGALGLEAARALFDRLLVNQSSPDFVAWAVTAKPEAEYCGHVFIHHHDRTDASSELGFVLLQRFQRRGLATEMAAAACDYARTQLGCRVVKATVDEDNEPSKAILTRIGMSTIARKVDRAGSFLVYATAEPNSGT
jgi:ribosomal-protein-alanine N-acetyltransferase